MDADPTTNAISRPIRNSNSETQFNRSDIHEMDLFDSHESALIPESHDFTTGDLLEEFKSHLMELSINRNQTAQQVIDHMSQFYSFRPDIRLLRQKFQEWGWPGNVEGSEWKSLSRELKRKNLGQHEVDVVIGMRPCSAKRLKKSISRHDPPTYSESSTSQDALYTSRSSTDQFLVRIKPPEPVVSVKIQDLPFFRFLEAVGIRTPSPPPSCLPENTTVSQSGQLLRSILTSTSTSRYMKMLNQRTTGPHSVLEGTSSRSYDLSCLLSQLCPRDLSVSKNAKNEDKIRSMFLLLEPILPQSAPGDLAEALGVVSYGSMRDGASVLGTYLIYLISNNFSNGNMDSELRKACAAIFKSQVDFTWLKLLVDQGQPTAKVLRQQLFHHAVETMDVLLVKSLLGIGASLNEGLIFKKWTDVKQTPLQYSLDRSLRSEDDRKRKDFMSALLALNADPNVCGCHGRANSSGSVCECLPINLCCNVDNCSDLIAILLRSGSWVDYQFDLTRAVTNGLHIEVLDMLLEAGASVHGAEYTFEIVDDQNLGCFYPLQAALGIQNIDMANALLDAGADAHWYPHTFIRDLLSKTDQSVQGFDRLMNFLCDSFLSLRMPPMLSLAASTSLEMVKRLLDAGADPDYCLCSATLKIRQYIMEHYKIGDPDEEWDLSIALSGSETLGIGVASAPMIAVARGNVEALQMILEKSTGIHDIHDCDACDGHSLLIGAAEVSNHSMVETILSYGYIDAVLSKDVLSKQKDGMHGLMRSIFSRDKPFYSTAIAAAAARSDPKMLDLLVRNASDVDACAEHGGLTALQAACFLERHENIEYLLTQTDAQVLHPGTTPGGISAIAATVLREDSLAYYRLVSCLSGSTIATSCFQQPLEFAVCAKDPQFFTHLVFQLGANVHSAEVVRAGVTSLESFLRLVNVGLQLHVRTEAGLLYELAIEATFKRDCRGVAQMLLSGDRKLPPKLSVELLQRTDWGTIGSEEQNVLLELLMAKSTWNACSKVAKCRLLQYVLLRSQVQDGNILFHGLVPVHETLLQAGFDAGCGHYGYRLLPVQIAINLGNFELLRLLVKHGADPHFIGKCVGDEVTQESRHDCPGVRALQRAALSGNVDIVRYFLRTSHDIRAQHARCKHGQTALAAAYSKNHTPIFITLLEEGADPNSLIENDGPYMLQDACAKGNTFEIISLLVAKGADVNAACLGKRFARTALQAACESGNFEVTKLLLRHQADVNAPAALNAGVTALQGAAIKGHFEIVRVLINQGADVAAPGASINGRTALEGASENGQLDIAKLLSDNYPDGGPTAEVCLSAVRYARKRCREDIVGVLLGYSR